MLHCTTGRHGWIGDLRSYCWVSGMLYIKIAVRVKMLNFIKLCLKSISSHSESFWGKKFRWKMGGTPIFSHFSLILAIQKIFTSVLTFLWGKVPKKWSSFFKKIHSIFRYIRGEGQTRCDICHIFFFEGVPKKYFQYVYWPDIKWRKGVTTSEDELVYFPLMGLSSTPSLIAGSTTRNPTGTLGQI